MNTFFTQRSCYLWLDILGHHTTDFLVVVVFRWTCQLRNGGHSLADLATALLEQGNDEQVRALCEESLAIWQQLGHKAGCAHTLCILGRLALQQGDVERATQCYQESLVLRQVTGEKEGIAAAMEGLARIAAVRGQARSAAQLFGAAEVLRTAMGTPLPPPERISHERVVAAVRANLNETAFAHAWAVGQAMPLEQAVAVALVISPRTVEAHVRSCLSKLGVSSRTAATHSAIAHQIVSLDIDQESVQ